MNRAPGDVRDRVVTVPNALSVLRLVLVPVFLYLLLVAHANGWAVARADVQRLLGLGRRQDRAACRQPVVAARGAARPGRRPDLHADGAAGVRRFAGIVPWWIVITLIGRDVVLAATLPVVRSRGLTALPVTYIGKGATFALMSALPADPARAVGRAVEPRRSWRAAGRS